ncbi:hypothetical protein [Spartinivicinus poritis]|uniref:Uncharacterized protein n=1 Tax=Spartinivicinus poritis TaxID=2994640 RepID=A0ABT5UDH2_9GAMM|nr:hypothetical protein [Spartinivicinus sp. A2-2]MDE1464426.1 hypothetical protein [Spartinivicinus sp. A2-2]
MKRTLFACLCISLYAFSATNYAAETVKTAPSTQDTVKSYLMQKTKKAVTLHLVSGKTLSGTVGTIGQHLVQLKSLTGKEFYDALVPFDKIEAVEVRNR